MARLIRIGDAGHSHAGNDRVTEGHDDETMMRKVFVSVLAVISTLVVTLTSAGTDARDTVLQGRAASVASTWTATQA